MMTDKHISSREVTKYILSFAVILGLTLSASGCGASITNLFKKKTATPSATTASNNAPAAKDLKVLKDDAPGMDISDLPRYPGSIRQSDTVIAGPGGKKSGTLLYQTSDNARDVLDFYEEQIDSHDWTIVDTLDTKDGKIILVSKGTRRASIDIARRADISFTDISIIYRES